MSADIDNHRRLQQINAIHSTLYGHLCIENLLKRWWMLSQRIGPATVDVGWSIAGPEQWERLARHALGYKPVYQETTREELHRMARSLVAGIDKLEPFADWYPEGWEFYYRVIKDGAPRPQTKASPSVSSAPAPNWRHSVKSAINYVACELNCSEEDVLRRIGRKAMADIRQGDDRKAMALIPGHEDAG